VKHLEDERESEAERPEQEKRSSVDAHRQQESCFDDVAVLGTFTPTQSPLPRGLGSKQIIGRPEGLAGQPFAPAQKSELVGSPTHEQSTV
jgi:hypothetical protein